MKLGKLAKRVDPRTLKLARFLPEHLPIPAARDWTVGRETREWGMLRNDDLGDCTCAALGHQVQVWSEGVAVTDADIVGLYSTVTGYDPITGAHAHELPA